MRTLAFATIIGLAISQQAWAWDDDYDDSYGRHRLSSSDRAQHEMDRMNRQFLESEMLYNQERSLRMQEESLELQKKRLKLEERREREQENHRINQELQMAFEP